MYSVSNHTRTLSLQQHSSGTHNMAGTIMWCGIPVFILFSLTNIVTSFSPKYALMSSETKRPLKLGTILLLLYLFQYLVTSMHKLNYFFRTSWTRFFSCEGTFHADGFICHVVQIFIITLSLMAFLFLYTDMASWPRPESILGHCLLILTVWTMVPLVPFPLMNY